MVSIGMSRWRGIVLILCLSLFGGGCAEDPSDESGLVGACIHTYEDNVLHIDEASGSSAGVSIEQLELAAFLVNGQSRSSEDIVAQGQSNVLLDGGLLRCTLPCSFGTESGRWEFVATAPGFSPTEQSANAEYSTFSGGCPSFETDGTHISLVLDEAGE
jgi:hypothetical protein